MSSFSSKTKAQPSYNGRRI